MGHSAYIVSVDGVCGHVVCVLVCLQLRVTHDDDNVTFSCQLQFADVTAKSRCSIAVSLCLSISVCPSPRLSVCMSVCPSLSVSMTVCMPVDLPILLYFSVFLSAFVYHYLCLSVRLSICIFVSLCMSVCPSVRQFADVASRCSVTLHVICESRDHAAQHNHSPHPPADHVSLSYHTFIVRRLLTEPRPQVHYKHTHAPVSSVGLVFSA